MNKDNKITSPSPNKVVNKILKDKEELPVFDENWYS